MGVSLYFMMGVLDAGGYSLMTSRLAELMLPDGAHLRQEDWTVFYLGQTSSSAVDPMLEHQSPSSQNRLSNTSASMMRRKSGMANDGKPREGIAGNGLLYVLNIVRMKEDKSMRRGAQVKALALCSPYPYIGIFKVSDVTRSFPISLHCA